MRRREAILLFREICECIPDMLISSFSLTPVDGFKGEFELRIFGSFNVKGFKIVQSIAQKYGMSVSQNQSSLIISDLEEQIELA